MLLKYDPFPIATATATAIAITGSLFQSSLLPPLQLGQPLPRPLHLPLLARHDGGPLIDRHPKGGDDALHDVVHVPALGVPRRELDHVALAQRVARVRDQVGRLLGVVLADVVVPDGVAVDHAHGAVHLADGDDRPGAHGVGVFAEGGEERSYCCGVRVRGSVGWGG